MACEVGSVGTVVFSLVSESLNKEPQTRGCHLCLTAHHQLTQSIVDEVILSLEEEWRGGEGGKDSECTHQAQRISNVWYNVVSLVKECQGKVVKQKYLVGIGMRVDVSD